MSSNCRALVVDRIRQRGPLTVADFMALALYAPGAGYYARAVQRSGRTGDFFTSVDAGPWFGRLLAARFGAWLQELEDRGGSDHWDLVEAGAGNGRLSRDVLDALSASHPDLYRRTTLHLVERSEAARAAQAVTLSGHAALLGRTGPAFPARVAGIIYANELLDAFPVHVVSGTEGGLAEIYVDALADGRLVERQGPPSTPALATYLNRLGVTLAPGHRGEINLEALTWMRDTASRLSRGYLVLIDYGHDAASLYSPERPAGTLATFHRHLIDAPGGDPGTPAWLADPGDRDLTAHVDLTSIRREAEAAGLETVTVEDQTRFLLGIAEQQPAILAALAGSAHLHDRLALKTLLVPGGLGTTHKVMVFRRTRCSPTASRT